LDVLLKVHLNVVNQSVWVDQHVPVLDLNRFLVLPMKQHTLFCERGVVEPVPYEVGNILPLAIGKPIRKNVIQAPFDKLVAFSFAVLSSLVLRNHLEIRKEDGQQSEASVLNRRALVFWVIDEPPQFLCDGDLPPNYSILENKNLFIDVGVAPEGRVTILSAYADGHMLSS